MAGSQIGRCSKLMRCPVDRKWRVVERVRPEQLSEEEIERARNWAPLKP
jgi:hypothetical protein